MLEVPNVVPGLSIDRYIFTMYCYTLLVYIRSFMTPFTLATLGVFTLTLPTVRLENPVPIANHLIFVFFVES